MLNDRRDEMSLAEIVEELELSHPARVASFERRYPEAMAAVIDDDLEACDPDELDDLRQDLRNLLRVEPALPCDGGNGTTVMRLRRNSMLAPVSASREDRAAVLPGPVCARVCATL
jgi:hypothetical protein